MSEQKYCVLTGATSGIGKEAAKELIHKGYNLILIVRNSKKGEKIKQQLYSLNKTPELEIEIVEADLSSLEDVRIACTKIKSKFNEISLLINNAGVFTPRKKLTKDNLEMTMGVNHFSHFLLTLELLPLLEKHGPEARIVNVSSVGHYKAPPFDIKNINFEKNFSGFNAYRISKLANILFTYKLADLLQKKNSSVTVNTLHPGVVRTNIARQFPIVGWLWRINPQYISAEKGARTTIYVATEQELTKTTGKYFSKMKEKNSSLQSYDQELQNKLWEVSLDITKASWK